MSLKDDMKVLSFYIERGLGEAYMRGELTKEQLGMYAEQKSRMPLAERDHR